jgi:hypothetical protein
VKKKPALIAALFFLAVVGFIIYSTMNTAASKVEVCMNFNGRTSCRIASAATREDAMRAAMSNACAELVSGVTDTLACGRQEPAKVTWLK